MTEFVIRDALPADKEEILALTANTWQGGDYVQWVFDDWIADTKGRFLVAEALPPGRIAGIDKMSFLSPSEAWFEGLRVHPDFRGQGLSTRFEKYMIEEAARRGATAIRLLTNVGNLPVHKNTYRHGFSQRFVVRHWRWPADGEGAPAASRVEPGYDLRAATREEAPILYKWWRRSPASFATGWLLNRNWSYSATSAEEWEERAARGELLVPQETDVSALAVPPPVALVSLDANDQESRWVMSTLSATAGEWLLLAAGLIDSARRHGLTGIGGLLPDVSYIYSACTQAGYTTGPDADSLSLFELHLK
jgi:GNAT superfamily N-acetyltransferase